MRKRKIALWSFGEHASRNILPCLMSHDAWDVAGIYSRSGLHASKGEDVRIFESVDQMLEFDGLDAIYVCNPNSMHLDSVLCSLNANRHVIVEKTAFLSPDEAKQANELAKSKGLIVYEAFMFVHHPQFLKLQEILQAELFGAAESMNIRFAIPERSPNDIRYRADLGGGALNDLGAYTVKTVAKLFQDRANIVAAGMRFGDCVDFSGWAKFDTLDVDISCSWALNSSYCNEMTIWCTEGTISIERAFSKPSTYSSSIIVRRNGEICETFDTGMSNHFTAMFHDFADRIQEGDVSAHEDLRVTNEIMQSIRDISVS